MEYYFDEIVSCECTGEFEDEFVYDIEVDDESHTFIGNDILVHNSLYLSYGNLLKTIEGIDEMDKLQKLDIIINLNTKFLNKHNCDFIREYFASRHVDSVHEFELETIAYSGAWLNVKKRYMQVIMWKDGKIYDEDKMPTKIKGLEIIKSSTPKLAREQLMSTMRYFLDVDEDSEMKFLQLMNIQAQKAKAAFMQADIEDISCSNKVKNYSNYIVDDTKEYPIVGPKCPPNVRALARYNGIINSHGLKDENIYGGKMKWYIVKNITRRKIEDYFAYQSKNLPSWSEKYAPIDRSKMFQNTYLDPLNRVLNAVGYKSLEADGNIELTLF